ncbi:hypothetical protein AVEN_241726-1 [Araneus ventricosus]|uniref:Uncharacterized protein n=1 Tax=Araneus ventricosus TaxID=182803 RepID=A0A4Y2RSF7_ARAVE|nr:hypothetical protein AVEN_241726-1 [Araneus ventricosus]
MSQRNSDLYLYYPSWSQGRSVVEIWCCSLIEESRVKGTEFFSFCDPGTLALVNHYVLKMVCYGTLERNVQVHVLSSSSNHCSKIRDPSKNSRRLESKWGANISHRQTELSREKAFKAELVNKGFILCFIFEFHF